MPLPSGKLRHSRSKSLPKKQKEGRVFWVAFFVTRGRACYVTNVIIACYSQDSSFLKAQTICGIIYKSSTVGERGARGKEVYKRGNASNSGDITPLDS